MKRSSVRVVAVAGGYIPARVMARPNEPLRATALVGAVVSATKGEADRWLANWLKPSETASPLVQ